VGNGIVRELVGTALVAQKRAEESERLLQELGNAIVEVLGSVHHLTYTKVRTVLNCSVLYFTVLYWSVYTPRALAQRRLAQWSHADCHMSGLPLSLRGNHSYFPLTCTCLLAGS